MKIEWNENPLRTKVIISDEEAAALVLKMKTNTMLRQSKIAKKYLEEGDAEKALQWIDQIVTDSERESAYDNPKSYQEALLDTHIGDCTCVACTCMKCISEYELGIDTISGLGKHEAHAIACAFGDWMVDDGGAVSIDVALERLKNWKPKEDALKDWDNRDDHIQRWIREHKVAYEWLLKYKTAHDF